MQVQSFEINKIDGNLLMLGQENIIININTR